MTTEVTTDEAVEAPDRPDTAFLENIWNKLDGKERILVVGNGSLGSAIRFALGRMSIRSVAVDPDEWEERNMANSFAGPEGSAKAEYKTTLDSLIKTETVTRDSFDLVITTTDNVESRREAFEFFRPRAGFVDARTAREAGTIVSSLFGNHMRQSLPRSEDIGDDSLSCAERGTMAHTMTISGLAVSRIIFMLDCFVDGRIPNDSFEQIGFRGSSVINVGQETAPGIYGSCSDDLVLEVIAKGYVWNDFCRELVDYVLDNYSEDEDESFPMTYEGVELRVFYNDDSISFTHDPLHGWKDPHNPRHISDSLSLAIAEQMTVFDGIDDDSPTARLKRSIALTRVPDEDFNNSSFRKRSWGSTEMTVGNGGAAEFQPSSYALKRETEEDEVF